MPNHEAIGLTMRTEGLMDTMYCKVITPMFLAGTDKNTPEFRAPSIRGALRWWFRAVAGGYVAHHMQVRRFENSLFGDPGNNKGGSSVIIRVRADVFDRSVKAPMLPHKQGNQSKTSCIPPGTLFKVTLKKSVYDPAQHAVETATTLFNLFATLGGLGRRVRRGFGAFQPTNWEFENVEAVNTHVEDKVREVRRTVKAFIDAHPPVATPPTFGANAVSEYPILHPSVVSIRVGEATDWGSFIEGLMPRCSAIQVSSKKVLGSGKPRQASTLLVSVLQLDGSQIVPVYTQFFCRTQNSSRNRNDFEELTALPDSVSSLLLSVSIL